MYDTSRYVPYFRTVLNRVVYPHTQVLQLCQANPNRVALLVTANETNPVYLVEPGVTSTGEGRFAVPIGTTFQLVWTYHGILTTLEWWGAMVVTPGQNDVWVTEVMWQPGVDL
jgi:hypothetical protein